MTGRPAPRRIPWLLRLPRLRRYGQQLQQAYAQQSALRDKLRALRERFNEERLEFGRRIQTYKGRQLAPDVLRHLLAPRHRALLDSGARHEALRDEARFAEVSESYAEARARHPGDLAPDVRRTRIESLSWSVPADAAGAGELADRIIRDHWLPFEHILATRDVGVGRVMIDIGANVGTTSIPRVVLGDVQRVYAAEPDPRNYACLVANVLDNNLHGFVLPDRVAIGDSDGPASLKLGGQIGVHHLVTRDAPDAVPVRSFTLDTWVARLGIDVKAVSFIKVDTQGWEARVLRGAARLLAERHIAWQLEFSPRFLLRAGSSADELLALVKARFTHFIDLSASAPPRSRPVSEIDEALAYVLRRERRYTDLIVYNAG